MITTIYVDPGVQQHGVAQFCDERRLRAVYFAGAKLVDDFSYKWTALRAVIETPRIYPHDPPRRPNDILELATAAGRLEGWLQRHSIVTRLVFPLDWKGQVKKPIHHQRIWRVLDERERDLVAEAALMSTKAIEAKIYRACDTLAKTGAVRRYSWKAHNLLDAVGIGLWDLRRTGKGGAKI